MNDQMFNTGFLGQLFSDVPMHNRDDFISTFLSDGLIPYKVRHQLFTHRSHQTFAVCDDYVWVHCSRILGVVVEVGKGKNEKQIQVKYFMNN